MQSKSLTKLDQDYRVFFVFMTLIMIGMYILALVQNPALQQPGPAILFTVLMIIHIVLHWMLVLSPIMPGQRMWK